MKIKKGWRKRIKNIFFGFQGTALHCPKCKSLSVTFGDSKVTKMLEISSGFVIREEYPVYCKDCKAVGHVAEVWMDQEMDM